MVRTVRTVEETTDEPVADSRAEAVRAGDTFSRVIWFIAGLILILLGFRFVLALLGANPGNSFAHFIYSASYPFVAPFFGLFSYNYSYGISRFEIYTLVAMLVYLVIAWGLVALVDIGRR